MEDEDEQFSEESQNSDVGFQQQDFDDGSESDSETEQPVRVTNKRNQQKMVQTGSAVRNQLLSWDNLLELRIRLQSVMGSVNTLPQIVNIEKILSSKLQDEEAVQKFCKVKSLMLTFVEKLIYFQRKLANTLEDENEEDGREEDSELSEPNRKKARADSEKVLVNKDKLDTSLEETILTMNASVSELRKEQLQKWSEKTRMIGGKWSKQSNVHIPILRQIDHIMKDKEKLVHRTRVNRSASSVIGNRKPLLNSSSSENDGTLSEEQVDPEIFDDGDFYEQLLRDLIERKTSDVKDPVQLSRNYLELQKLRSKLKIRVDTKESKGRKIRYDVMSKLVNFMAPFDDSPWSDNAVKELMSSLFSSRGIREEI